MKKISFLISVLTISTALSAKADTLEAALAKAYEYNPVLKAARASAGAVDETVALAKAGYRPTLSVQGGYTDSKINSNGAINGVPQKVVDGYNRTLQATISEPVFSGFKTINSISAAKSNVKAAHANLMAMEQNVLLNAATAYLDVLRDEAIVKLQKNNEKLLKKELDETRERFHVGEVTTTDVSQAEASYASAQSGRISAEGNLEASKAVYKQIIGEDPKKISDPKEIEKMFPKSLDGALDYAKTHNYALSAAKHTLKARKYDVKTNKGDLLPSVNAYATAGRLKSQNYLYDKNPTNDSVEVGVNFSMPIYNAGTSRAKIRQSKYYRWQAREDVLNAQDELYSDITSYWEYLSANKAKITSVKAQIKAYQVALNGVREEEALGNRTVLDVLNQYQYLLNSEVEEVRTRHDYYVSGLNLLQAMGKLTAKDLNLKVDLYDANAKYEETAGKWLSTSIDNK
ncbi:MAG: TolC family outer membrane protein [Alphaproteobacteria bacterium]|nr:TolC family outer membrane protein [Alphaproteobacteria bacterium]